MSVSNNQPTSYNPSTPPELSESLIKWVYDELRRLAQTISELVARSPAYYQAEPTNPRKGQVVYAESPWNPGGGDGFYGYTGSAWVKLN